MTSKKLADAKADADVDAGCAMMNFIYNDGGRKTAGYKGHAGDCVARSIAIATGKPYQEVYTTLAKGTGEQRASRRTSKRSASARNGINTRRKWFRDYMASIGWRWVPTMQIGQGCKVHLAAGELPQGRLIVAVSKHYTAVIDGVIHDTHDPQREASDEIWTRRLDYQLVAGERELDRDEDKDTKTVCRPIGGRCVYGYWIKA